MLPLSAGEHRAIVAAIASRQPEAAGRAMFEHAMESKQRMLSQHSPRPLTASAVPRP